MTRHRKWIFAALGFLLFPATVFSAASDIDFNETPWQEAEVSLPDFPETENLIPFQVGAESDKRFLIDKKSVSVASDGVIRYTVVVISSAGAKTINFEGMRCPTHERQVYAFGRDDGKWSRARNSTWAKIRGGERDYPVALSLDYFCVIGQPAVTTTEEAIRILRDGGE